jgi:hypothetical protein
MVGQALMAVTDIKLLDLGFVRLLGERGHQAFNMSIDNLLVEAER